MDTIFKAGTIFWSPKVISSPKQLGKTISIDVPTRVCTFPVFFEKFIVGMREHEYSVKHILFSTELATHMRITVTKEHQEVRITNNSQKNSIIVHSVKILKKILNLKHGFEISYRQDFPSKAGMSSSASLQASVMIGINEIFGKPIQRNDLIKLAVKNYGEDTEKLNILVHVPALGSVITSALYGGGVIALGNKSKVEARAESPGRLHLIIGTPEYDSYQGLEDLDEIRRNTQTRVDLGTFSQTKNMIFEKVIIPSLKARILEPTFSEIWKFTNGDYGDVASYYDGKHPDVGMKRLLAKLLDYKEHFLTGFVSSAGPSIVLIATETTKARQLFKLLKINRVTETHIGNIGFKSVIN